jgi:hypothetical protein
MGGAMKIMAGTAKSLSGGVGELGPHKAGARGEVPRKGFSTKPRSMYYTQILPRSVEVKRLG